MYVFLVILGCSCLARDIFGPFLNSVSREESLTCLNMDPARDENLIGHLVLPSEDPEQWAVVQQVLTQPMTCLADLDTILTQFSSADAQPRKCTFFRTVPSTPDDAGLFDFDFFWKKGLPLLVEVALEMPTLFEGVQVPIYKMRSSWTASSPSTLGKCSFSLTRRQCACLLAHSFLGSLKRPPAVQPNDFRFTVSDLFIGTAVSPNSATTFLNYFNMLAKHGIPEDEVVTFERRGYKKGQVPWKWEENDKPLCEVALVTGNIDDCTADLHAEFSNAFIGGGVMTGDAAMEEILFLVKPELMVAMALENRMVDEEAICVSGAKKYSLVDGYGQSFTFAGDYDANTRPGPLPTVCAIDAIRGGGPATTEPALLRDMNKARIAFDGATELATGHWGCGAFGNNHDLMFLKQWLAASEAGVKKIYYHDFNNKQSHHILPLLRKLKHLTVGGLWSFIQELTVDLRKPVNMSAFCTRMADVAVGKRKVPAVAGASSPGEKNVGGA